MAHPKRRISKTRRDKRRTHYKATPLAITTCQETGEAHVSHRAYVVNNDLYYNGKLAIEGYLRVRTA